MPEPGSAIHPDSEAVIEEMTASDYDGVRVLLESTAGITRRSADARESTERYLARNPGMSFVAKINGRVVGCVMCGHDGRRGYLQHLAVEPALRGRGIGSRLVLRCLAALKDAGIDKTHLDVLAGNQAAQSYWVRRGWRKRDDIVRFSFTNSEDSNA